MRKPAIIILGAVAVALGVATVYFSSKKTARVSSTGGRPINTLPARAYAQNPNYNPQAQPPVPTFTPFSGVPVVEGLLRSWQSSSGGDYQNAQPVSYDTTDTSSTSVSDSGTTTFWG